MACFVAFLRGMNLGGRRIGNAELCASFEAIGLADPRAFLASGNVVFEARGTPASLRKRLEQGLAAQLGYPVPTFVRTAARVRALAAARPFADRPGADARGKLQVVLVHEPPSAAAAKAVRALATNDDWLAIDERAVLWWPCGRLSDSELDIAALERAVGPTTIRTKNTIDRLAAKYLG